MIGENRVRDFCNVHLDGMALQSTTTLTTTVGKKTVFTYCLTVKFLRAYWWSAIGERGLVAGVKLKCLSCSWQDGMLLAMVCHRIMLVISVAAITHISIATSMSSIRQACAVLKIGAKRRAPRPRLANHKRLAQLAPAMKTSWSLKVCCAPILPSKRTVSR